MENKASPARAQESGSVSGLPLLLLRIEGFAVAAAAIIAFGYSGQSWWLLAALILAPDLSMLAYLGGPRLGALAYNAVHLYLGPLALAGIGFLVASPMLRAIALIWIAHIAIDRLFGYGLKYPEGFGITHLGRIGRAEPHAAS